MCFTDSYKTPKTSILFDFFLRRLVLSALLQFYEPHVYTPAGEDDDYKMSEVVFRTREFVGRPCPSPVVELFQSQSPECFFTPFVLVAFSFSPTSAVNCSV